MLNKLDNLNNKNIFITGGTGFIGKNILKCIIDHGAKPLRVTILSRSPEKFKQAFPELIQPWLTFEKNDIKDLEWNNLEYDYFIHAATSVVEQQESITLFDEIIIGTKKALKFAQKANVKVFINFSSGVVYHPNGKLEGLKETSPLLSNLQSEKNTYGLAKIAAEHLAYLYSKESNVIVITLRCFSFAGSYLEPTRFAIGEFVKKALNNEDIVVQAGGGIYRSYLAVSDLAKQIFEILVMSDTLASRYEVYNLGSDDAISLHSLAHRVVKVLDSKSIVTMPNTSSRTINYYVPNVDKLKDAIKKTLNNYVLENIITDLANFYQCSSSSNINSS